VTDLPLHAQVAPGSASMLSGPALTPQQCDAAMKVGADAAVAALHQPPSNGPPATGAHTH
jgi:hypothetical protein